MYFDITTEYLKYHIHLHYVHCGHRLSPYKSTKICLRHKDVKKLHYTIRFISYFSIPTYNISILLLILFPTI